MTKYDHMIPATFQRGNLLDHGHYAFDLLDKKGRSIGYRWEIFAMDILPAPRDGGGYYLVDPALIGPGRCRIICTVTRDGTGFGPAPSFNDMHADLETARREVVRRAEAARKRYARMPDVTASPTAGREGPALLTAILNNR